MNRLKQILAAAKQQYVRKGYTRDAFTEGAQWADEHPKSPWISVEDRLPETDEIGRSIRVLLRANSTLHVLIALYDYENNVWRDDSNWCEITEPTHWMPIPELPEVE